MQVLYISYDGLTDPLGQSQIIPYLTGLAQKGHKLTILSCEKKHLFTYQNVKILCLLQKYNINWVPVNYTHYPPILSTIWNIFKLKRKAFHICRQQKITIVHCRSYVSSLVGIYLKSKFNLKFIFDMRGFWADERVDGRLWNLKNPLYKLIYNYFKTKELRFLRLSDFTITLTENARKEIHRWQHLPCQPIPIEVIPCCADKKYFSIESVNFSLLSEFKKSNIITNQDFILSYLGSIGTWYMLEEMLLFFKQLLVSNPYAKFLFITHEPKESILVAANKTGVPSAKLIIKSATREEVPTLLSISKLSIFFIKPVFSKIASSPTKFGEALSMGIPVICNSGIGDVDAVIQESKCGLLINNFNDEEYLKAINKIDDLLLTRKEQIVSTANKFFSLETGIERYHKIYQQIITFAL